MKHRAFFEITENLTTTERLHNLKVLKQQQTYLKKVAIETGGVEKVGKLYPHLVNNLFSALEESLTVLQKLENQEQKP